MYVLILSLHRYYNSFINTVTSKTNRSRNGLAYNRTPKTDLLEVNFSEHSEFLEKCQLQKFLSNSSSSRSFLFEICVTIIAKVTNEYFSAI